MNAAYHIRSGKGREGIALIVVIGFLSILTVMAVSFAINMRTERLTSNMYLDSVRSRHLLDVALSRALLDIDTTMNGALAPGFEVLQSPGIDPIDLYVGMSTNYLPSDWTVKPPPSGFNTISITNSAGAKIDVGRYSYLIFNLGGFLDMNWVGTSLDRKSGLDPGEITISDTVLPDIANAGQWGLFRNDLLKRWRRIETLDEFHAIGGAYGISPQNFLPYSRSLEMLTPEGDEKMELGGSREDILIAKAPITEILRDKCDINGAVVDDVFNCILDFVDDDNIPENPQGLSGEAVPMINEVAASGRFTKTAAGTGVATYSLVDFKIALELWYPFPINGAETFTAPTDPIFDITTAPAGLPASLIKDIVVNLNPTNNGAKPTLYLSDNTPLSAGNFTVDKRGYYVVEYRYPTTTYTTNDTPNLPRMPITIGTRGISVSYGGSEVDFVSAIKEFQLRIEQNSTDLKGSSANDPRLSHLKGDWDVQQTTLGGLNAGIDGSQEPIGLDPVMYCRNYPLNKDKPGAGYGSVAELGYISLGQPWRTIALYENPGKYQINAVLDYFKVTIPGTSDKRYGLVNVNSRRLPALASVFYDMPVNAAPEAEPDLRVLDATLANQMANAIIAKTSLVPFDRMSKIGSLPTIYSPSFDASLDSDERIESLIRNSVGLLSLRDNVFGIILDAEALRKSGAQTIVTGKEKALAVVWRDPLKVGGVNQTIVRYYTFLED